MCFHKILSSVDSQKLHQFLICSVEEKNNIYYLKTNTVEPLYSNPLSVYSGTSLFQPPCLYTVEPLYSNPLSVYSGTSLFQPPVCIQWNLSIPTPCLYIVESLYSNCLKLGNLSTLICVCNKEVPLYCFD